MTVWDYLATPQGIEVTHAFLALLTVATGLLATWAQRTSQGNRRLLNGHLRAHREAEDHDQGHQ